MATTRKRLVGPGLVKLASGWTIKLPLAMRARYERRYDDHVFEIDGLTFRYWDNKTDERPSETVKTLICRHVSEITAADSAFKKTRPRWGLKLSYFRNENRPVRGGKRRVIHVCYAYAITATHFIHFQGYADKESDLRHAVRAFASIRPTLGST